MPKLAFVPTVLLAACISHTAAFAQEDPGSPEQQAACTRGAFRLCSRDSRTLRGLKAACGKESWI
jgi:hypothetical protein